MSITLTVKMNDEPTSYYQIIAGVKNWRLSGDLLSIFLINGDNMYINKDYIISIKENKED